MAGVFNWAKNQVAGFAGVLNYGLTHLDQFSTAGDVIVIQHADGTLHSTAFNVRFGKISVPRPGNKIVQIKVNDELIQAVMKLRPDGTAYFVESSMGHIVGPNGTPYQSPPRSPVLSNASAPSSVGAGESLGSPNHQQLPDLSLGAAAAAAVAASPSSPGNEQGGEDASKNNNNNKDDPEQQQQPQEELVIDEGSAVELAREHPEIRDLVTSIVGESREHQHDEEAAAAAAAAEHGEGGGTTAGSTHSSKNASFASPSGSSASIMTGGPPGHSRTRSLEGGANSLRLSKFASTDNLAAYQNLMATDDSFAALMKEMPEVPPPSHNPLTLAASAASLASPAGSPAQLEGEADEAAAAAAAAANSTADSPMKRDSTLDSTGMQPQEHSTSSSNAVASNPQQPQTMSPSAQQPAPPAPEGLLHPPLPSQGSLVMDDDYIDDSSDDEYLVLPISPQVSSTAAPDGGGLEPGAAGAGAALAEEGGDALDATTNSARYQQSLKHTTTPGHNELVKFNLKDGCNTVKFIVYSQTLTRSTEVEARIFLWPYTAKVIVSDIDGTVTKSDVMGHLSALLRWDWTHPGLCDLYQNIHRNGYKMLYLTARSLCQTSSTRGFLESVTQEDKKLPDGPVFTAPEKLFAALTQELMKRSHIFKTECLNSVKAVFPKSLREPLYAGFGNRVGDSTAYQAVGIPLHKIFIIDESSVVHVCQVKRTYRDLAHLVDVTFPPISGKMHASELPVTYQSVSIVNGAVTPVPPPGSPDSQHSGGHQQQQFPPPGVYLASTSSAASLNNQSTNNNNNNNNNPDSNTNSINPDDSAEGSCRSATPANSITPVLGGSSNSNTVSPNVYGSTTTSAGPPSPQQIAGSSSGLFRETGVTSSIHPGVANNSNNTVSPPHSVGSANGGLFPPTVAGDGGAQGSRSRSPSSEQQQQKFDGSAAATATMSNIALPPPLSATTTANHNSTTTLGQSQLRQHIVDLESSTMEEKVEFNNFNYWSVDPKSLTNASAAGAAEEAKATSSVGGSSTAPTTATTSPAAAIPIPAPAAGDGSAGTEGAGDNNKSGQQEGGDVPNNGAAPPAAAGGGGGGQPPPAQGWLSWMVGRKA